MAQSIQWENFIADWWSWSLQLGETVQTPPIPLMSWGPSVLSEPSLWELSLSRKPTYYFFFSVRAWSVTQSCLTLHHSRDYSSLGSSVHGIFQARILEWVAISYSRGSSWPRGQIRISCFGRWVLYHCATWKAVFLFTCFWLHWVLVAACRPSLVVVSSGHSPVSCA